MFTDHVNFGFNRGSEIPDKQKQLLGDAALYRYIKVYDKEDFPEAYIKQLLEMAYENSVSRLKQPARKKCLKRRNRIVKSISPVEKKAGIKFNQKQQFELEGICRSLYHYSLSMTAETVFQH